MITDGTSSASRAFRRLAALCGAAFCFGAGASMPAHAQDAPAPATPPPAAPNAAVPNAAPPATAPPTAPAAPTTTPTPAAPASPAPAAPAAPTGVQFSGLIDGYFNYAFNNPKTGPYSPDNSFGGFGPIYNNRYNTPTLSLAELNIALAPPTKGGFGFKVTATAGDTADINHSQFNTTTTTPEGRYKFLQQFYATYGFDGGGEVDFGKFYTPYGYEVTEANQNPNYSHSLAYNLLPFYHFGGRLISPNYNGFTGTIFVVGQINNGPDQGFRDPNHGVDVIVSANYTEPKASKYVIVETLGGGSDGKNDEPDSFDGGGKDKVYLSDTDLTFNFTPTQFIGLNYVYRTDGFELLPHLKSNGYAFYYKNQLKPKDAIALRFSESDQKPNGSDTARADEVTATYEYKVTPAFLTRVELRHDTVNHTFGPVFLDSNGLANQQHQDTLTVAGIFTFP